MLNLKMNSLIKKIATKFLGKLFLCTFVVFLLLGILSHRASTKGVVVPTSKMLEIWEYSCIEHIKNKNFKRAFEVLDVMNWQCDNKTGFSSGNDDFLQESDAKLSEVRNAKQEHKAKSDAPWVCHPSSSMSKTKKDFYKTVAKEVADYLHKKGVNNDTLYVVIAQIIQETSWGKKVFGNNYFNIKGEYKGQFVEFKTAEEYEKGKWVSLVDKFRKYPGLSESVEDYLEILKAKWPVSYKSMFDSSSDNNAKTFINALKAGQVGGYATDKNYGSKLLVLFEQVKVEMKQNILPTYLKCLGRENELKVIMEGDI